MQFQAIVGILCNASLVTLFFPSSQAARPGSRAAASAPGGPVPQAATVTAPLFQTLTAAQPHLTQQVARPTALVASAGRQLARDAQSQARVLRSWSA